MAIQQVKFTLLEEREDKDILNKTKTQISGLAASPTHSCAFDMRWGMEIPNVGTSYHEYGSPHPIRVTSRDLSPHTRAKSHTRVLLI